jgi:acetyl esterase/lipase
MPSLAAHALSLLFRFTRKPQLATEAAARARVAAPKWDPAPPRRYFGTHRISERTVGGFPVYTVLPAGPSQGTEPPERAVVYLHGGAYVSAITSWHWALITRIADQGVRVEVPLYGLAPDHTHREALPFVEQVYRELLADVAAGRTAFAGDSAGGGLALALSQTLPGAGLPVPGRLVLISPWVEMTMTNPGIAGIEPKDPWLATVGGLVCAHAWADGDDLADPRLSPVNGPMAGQPPTDVYIGTRDLFLPDVRELCDRLAGAGVPVRKEEAEGLFHVYPLIPCPEGARARDRILRTLREL